MTRQELALKWDLEATCHERAAQDIAEQDNADEHQDAEELLHRETASTLRYCIAELADLD